MKNWSVAIPGKIITHSEAMSIGVGAKRRWRSKASCFRWPRARRPPG
jgi:hypothetical protein